MIINLNQITKKEFMIESEIVYPKEYCQKIKVLELKPVSVVGTIRKDINQDYILDIVATGTMILADARTLEPIHHAFKIEINEKIADSNDEIQEYFEKNKNTLDIMGILWENIVLEVPMRLTSIKEDFTECGDGWELVSEKTEKLDPRLAPLGHLLEIEKE